MWHGRRHRSRRRGQIRGWQDRHHLGRGGAGGIDRQSGLSGHLLDGRLSRNHRDLLSELLSVSMQQLEIEPALTQFRAVRNDQAELGGGSRSQPFDDLQDLLIRIDIEGVLSHRYPRPLGLIKTSSFSTRPS
jgi:hypothetical protein